MESIWNQIIGYNLNTESVRVTLIILTMKQENKPTRKSFLHQMIIYTYCS